MPNASESGPQGGVVTVSRSGTTTGSLTVHYSVGGAATSGADYAPLSGSVTISNGSASALITIAPVDDALAEPGETVVITLVTNAAYTIHAVLGSATVTIADNDVAALSISDASVVEGTGGASNALFQVTLSLPSSQWVTVPYATSDGTALAGMDYTATGHTLQFIPGQTTQTLGITVSGDALFEAHEVFFVNLGSPTNATLARSQGVGTIVDDEVRVTLAAREGDHVRLEFNTLPGRSYRVERNDNLGATNAWSAVAGASNVAGTGGIVPVTDTNAFPLPRGFYRVRLLP
jgi:hypothetical protein